MRAKKISILGSGTVGFQIGKGLLELGNAVRFYDVNESRIHELRQASYQGTHDIIEAVSASDMSFICVPTPTLTDGTIDLHNIVTVVKDLATVLRTKDDYHLVVVKSTVLPTTTEKTIIPLLEEGSKRRIGEQIGVCMNPEFLTEIHLSWTDDPQFARGFFNEPFIVIGQYDERSGATLEHVYRSIPSPIFRTTLRSAEMIKYAVNCALAARISYWNEIFNICRKLGVDSHLLASISGNDARIGKYGTIHGKAFGGKCLPKDLQAFITFSNRLGYQPRLLEAVRDINQKIAVDFGIRE